MDEDMQILCNAYCVGEYTLAQQKHLRLADNPHTRSVRQRAIKIVEQLAPIIEGCGYDICVYVNESSDRSMPSTVHQNIPMYERGIAYFNLPPNGGIVFISKENNSSNSYSPPLDMLNFQSGRLDSEEAYSYFLRDIKPAFIKYLPARK